MSLSNSTAHALSTEREVNNVCIYCEHDVELFNGNILITVLPLRSTWFSYGLVPILPVHAWQAVPVRSAEAASGHFNQMDTRICREDIIRDYLL